MNSLKSTGHFLRRPRGQGATRCCSHARTVRCQRPHAARRSNGVCAGVSPEGWPVHRASGHGPGLAASDNRGRGGRSTVALYRRRPARAPRCSAGRRTHPSVVSLSSSATTRTPGLAAGAETGIAPSAPGRLRRGHRGRRGLIPLPVGLGRVRRPYRLARSDCRDGSRAPVTRSAAGSRTGLPATQGRPDQLFRRGLGAQKTKRPASCKIVSLVDLAHMSSDLSSKIEIVGDRAT